MELMVEPKAVPATTGIKVASPHDPRRADS
jgi:hypothetical protein